jgi:plasmid maintenance system antidote protein VapI
MAQLQQAASNPLGGAQSTEDRFENLWQGGAFDSQNPKEAAQLQAERGTEPAEPIVEQTTVQPVELEQSADPAQNASEQATEPDYANLDDYLQKASIEQSSFYELPVTVKVDGKTSQVKLADVLKSYQLEQHVQAKSIAISESQRAWEAQQTQARQLLEGQLAQAQALGTLARQNLMSEFQKIDWNRLRVDDPAQWAVLNTEFNQKAAAIDQHLATVQNQQVQMAQQAEQQRLAQLPKEREAMLAARPEWRDEKQFQAARVQMTTFAKSLGFTDADIASIYDHRQMLALDMAARYAALQASSPQALKRVRSAPQVANPGARIQRDPNQVARQELRKAFQKNPRDQDAAVRYFGTLS